MRMMETFLVEKDTGVGAGAVVRPGSTVIVGGPDVRTLVGDGIGALEAEVGGGEYCGGSAGGVPGGVGKGV